MADLVTQAQLLKFAPQALQPSVAAPALSKHMDRCQINTPRRIRHFMAHLYVESAAFARLEENLNYSAAGLQQTWPKRFPTPASAIAVARNPREIAKIVYGGRGGNNTLLDGWLYRGGGYIQLTFRDNYRSASGWTGLDLVAHPEWARTPAVAAQIACDFWRVDGLNALVERDPDEKVIAKLSDSIRINEEDDLEDGTRKINGGLNGLAARRAALLRAASIWS